MKYALLYVKDKNARKYIKDWHLDYQGKPIEIWFTDNPNEAIPVDESYVDDWPLFKRESEMEAYLDRHVGELQDLYYETTGEEIEIYWEFKETY